MIDHSSNHGRDDSPALKEKDVPTEERVDGNTSDGEEAFLETGKDMYGLSEENSESNGDKDDDDEEEDFASKAEDPEDDEEGTTSEEGDEDGDDSDFQLDKKKPASRPSRVSARGGRNVSAVSYKEESSGDDDRPSRSRGRAASGRVGRKPAVSYR